MKKMITSILIIGGLSASTFATAKDANRPTRGTQSWFVTESVEHVVRKLAATDIQSLSVELTGPEDSIVTITKESGEEQQFNCFMFEESSRGGTVLKKEVVCR